MVQVNVTGSAEPAGSVAVALRAKALPSGAPAGTVKSVMVGATLFTVSVKVVVAFRPSESVAVMVTVVGPSGPSAGVYDQLQVPAVSSLVTVPSEALIATVLRPSTSSKVPVFVAWEPSSTVMASWLRVIVGDLLGTSKAPMSTVLPRMRAKPAP